MLPVCVTTDHHARVCRTAVLVFQWLSAHRPSRLLWELSHAVDMGTSHHARRCPLILGASLLVISEYRISYVRMLVFCGDCARDWCIALATLHTPRACLRVCESSAWLRHGSVLGPSWFRNGSVIAPLWFSQPVHWARCQTGGCKVCFRADFPMKGIHPSSRLAVPHIIN